MPNYSLLLRKPPPTVKGVATKETILETLPNIGEAVSFATMAVVLTGDYTDKVSAIMKNASAFGFCRLNAAKSDLLFHFDRFSWATTPMKDLTNLPLRR